MFKILSLKLSRCKDVRADHTRGPETLLSPKCCHIVLLDADHSAMKANVSQLVTQLISAIIRELSDRQ